MRDNNIFRLDEQIGLIEIIHYFQTFDSNSGSNVIYSENIKAFMKINSCGRSKISFLPCFSIFDDGPKKYVTEKKTKQSRKRSTRVKNNIKKSIDTSFYFPDEQDEFPANLLSQTTISQFNQTLLKKPQTSSSDETEIFFDIFKNFSKSFSILRKHFHAMDENNDGFVDITDMW